MRESFRVVANRNPVRAEACRNRFANPNPARPSRPGQCNTPNSPRSSRADWIGRRVAPAPQGCHRRRSQRRAHLRSDAATACLEPKRRRTRPQPLRRVRPTASPAPPRHRGPRVRVTRRRLAAGPVPQREPTRRLRPEAPIARRTNGRHSPADAAKLPVADPLSALASEAASPTDSNHTGRAEPEDGCELHAKTYIKQTTSARAPSARQQCPEVPIAGAPVE